MALKSIIATVQDQEIELTYNSQTGYYEGTGKAGSDSSFPQPGGYFPVSIEAIDNTDLTTTVDSNHSTYGDNLKLFVAEEHKPQISIITPGEGGYITSDTMPSISFEVYDNKVQTKGYSGIKKSSVVLKIDDAVVSGVTLTDIDGGFRGTYTPSVPLDNGEHEIKVDCADNDGNSADTATRTFEIDNQAPSLEVYTPTDGSATSVSRIAVTGKTLDANTPITVEIMLNNVNQGSVTVNADGTFSKNIDLSTQGDNVIKVIATDSIGNKSTERTITVRYNTTAPIFEKVDIIYDNSQVSASNKVAAGSVYLIRCKVTTAS